MKPQRSGLKLSQNDNGGYEIYAQECKAMEADESS